MADLISYFQTSDNIFWGNDIYRWWFYLSIILIIILEKRKMVKRVYAIYPIIFYIALFNPIIYEVIKFFSGGLWQYYARLYSMLPLPYTLALATILLIDGVLKLTNSDKLKIKEQNENNQPLRHMLRIALVFGAFSLIVFGGTNVYLQDWMQESQNIGKVPNEAIWICNVLHSEEGITIAVPASLSSYIRQIDASLFMPYGRHMNSLGNALSQNNPDPVYVMSEAGKEACNYIVIYNNEENKESFSKVGYEPEHTIGNYMVYAVNGVPRKKNIYDKRHYLIEEKYLDEKGSPVLHGSGYSAVQYTYDQIGNRVMTTYLDENGEPTDPDGYASIRRFYTSFSRQIASQTYLSPEGMPIKIFGRVETRYEYDANRNLIRESYFDEKGQPMERTDQSYASKRIVYNEKGRKIGEEYYNIEGERTNSSLGYASYQRILGSSGEIIGETYYDENSIAIGSVSTEGNNSIDGNIFNCIRCSEGVSITNDQIITLESHKKDNRFDIMYFYLNTASSDEYVTSFGEWSCEGEVAGTYQHNNPTGLYFLRLKGNSNISDEWVESLIYLEEGEIIDYSFVINEFSPNRIVFSKMNVSTKIPEDNEK